MSFWTDRMPAGMLLRSPYVASHITDPGRAGSLDAYQLATGGTVPVSAKMQLPAVTLAVGVVPATILTAALARSLPPAVAGLAPPPRVEARFSEIPLNLVPVSAYSHMCGGCDRHRRAGQPCSNR